MQYEKISTDQDYLNIILILFVIMFTKSFNILPNYVRCYGTTFFVMLSIISFSFYLKILLHWPNLTL